MRNRRADKHEAAAKTPKGARGPRPVRVPSFASFWLRAFLGIALILLLALSGVLYAWAVKGDADRLRELRSGSSVVVSNLGRRVTALRERLDAWATDPALQRVVRSGKPEDLRAQEQALTPLVPYALGVRLLPAGSGAAVAETDTLSYAGLDLVQQAEQRRVVTPVEVHRLGQSDAHLAVAGPILDDTGAKAVGTLYISLPLSWLPILPSSAEAAGRLAFQQQVDQAAVTIDPGRGLAKQDVDPDVTVPIPNTRLRVAGWVARDGVFQTDSLLYAGIGYAVLLGLVAAILWLVSRAFKGALATDLAAVVALAEDAAAGRPMRHPDCRLEETRPVVEMLTRLLRGVRVTDTTAVAGEAGAPAVVATPVEPAGAAESADHPSVKRRASEPLPKAPAQSPTSAPTSPPRPRIDPAAVPATIFRAYDIRGVVGVDLTPTLMNAIGLAIGSEAAEAGDQTVIVARDTRPSGKELSRALLDGIRASGRDVVDLDIAPTPLLYFGACYQGPASGAMVTGSHNPADYNGLKVVIGGKTLEGDRIRALRDRILSGRFTRGEGSLQKGDLITAYVDRVEKDVAVAYTMKVVVDCGNGAASVLAPRLYRGLGCEVVQTDCDLEAGFPEGRVPDPSRPECLEALQRRVVEENADLGLAFDTDGDRLGVVDSSGKIIWTDRVLMLLAADVLSRHPGTDVVFDVKSSHHLASEILRNGGRPVMWRSGHSPLKAKLQETGGLLAGEWSGHIMFRERWYGFDDAIYAGARLLEVLALDPRPSAEVFAALPEALATPALFLPLTEGEPAHIMEAVMKYADRLEGVAVQTIDGLRADSDRGWGLVRASNTQPALMFRFEGDDEAALAQIKELFRRLMARAAPDLDLPF